MNALSNALPIISNDSLPPISPNALPPSLPNVAARAPAAVRGGIWTDERVETLKRLWTAGLSASQIAAEIGGMTRNAVIGKIHRLGLGQRVADPQRAARKSTGTRNPKPRRQLVRTQQADGTILEQIVPYVPESLPPPDPQFMCTLEELGALQSEKDAESVRCRAPFGDPGTDGFRYCGTPGAQLPGPYCAFHRRAFYQAGSANGARSPSRIRVDGGDTDRGRALAQLEYTDHDGAGAVPPVTADD